MKRERYNGGNWTESRFNSFIKSTLRTGSIKWPPRYETLNDAFVGSKTNAKTGRQAKHYKCNRCQCDFPLKEVQVNHIDPVVPVEGFTTWDDIIHRMYCEKDKLEVLCIPCHKEVTQEENILRKTYK